MPPGVTAALLAWIGLGGLGLMRFSPRLREPPRWILHLGVADLAFFVVIAIGVNSAGGLR